MICHDRKYQQVCVQPPTAARNVTLLAFAAVDMNRKAIAPAADAPCSNRSIDPAGPTAANPTHAAAAVDR